MAERDVTTLRRRALVLFAVVIGLDVAFIMLSHGLTGRPGLRHPGHLDLGDVAAIGSLAVVGLVLTWARPRNSIGWLLSLTGVIFGVLSAGGTYGTRALVIPEEHLPLGAWALALSSGLWVPALLMPGTVVLVRYPSGQIGSRWARRFDRSLVLGWILFCSAYAMSDSAVSDTVVGGRSPLHASTVAVGPLFVTGAVLLLAGLFGIVADAIRRLVRSDRDERLALVWLLTAAVVAVTVTFLGSHQWLGSVAYAFQLVAIAVGVFRYGALGIEVVVRRALLYVTLTGLVVLVFVGVVTGLAHLIPSGPGPQIVAAAVIAIGLAPVRERLQAIIDRLLYGERSDPLAALQRLSAPVYRSASSGSLLGGVAQAVGEALRVPSVTFTSPDGIALAQWGSSDLGTATSLPLRFGGSDVGTMWVATRSGERSLGNADRRLLDGITPLIAAVLRSERLAADVEDERNRVVEATTAERARLRQELHDGLGPSLTGIGLGLEAAQTSPLASDTRTAELVSRLRTEVASSLEEIRRIIDDLRPRALDSHDLLSALRERGERVSSAAGLTVAVDAPPVLPTLPPDTETAALRIADEALTNVVRHAHASLCTVHVSVGDTLRLVVRDDGCGVGSGRDGGVGLMSMRQRAERIGGRFSLSSAATGTEIVAELPLETA